MSLLHHHPLRAGLAVGALAGLLVTGCHGGSRPATASPASAPAPVSDLGSAPAPVTTPAAAPENNARPATTIAGTFLWNTRDLSGGGKLFRVRGAARKTVLTGTGVYAAELSPDGRRLAYLDDGAAGTGTADLMVANADGSGARKLRSDVTYVGFGPSWSPDGTKLLTAIVAGGQEWRKGTVRVSDGRFTPLPKALQDGVHHRWSGDGRRIAWTADECVVWHGRTDGSDVRRVPVLGDPDSSTNPRKLRACDIVSVNPDAGRMTVGLAQGNDPNGDIGGTQWANAVIETATGKVLPLPVRGKVVQALYRTDGNLLVVTEAGGRTTLTLLSPDHRVLAAMPQPAGAKGLSLHDHAR